jgi:nucleotide-binding universal stress UspA family protein
MGRILLATDGSEYSEGAVREAVNMAKTCGDQICAMSVVEINPEFIALAPLIMEELEKERKEYLEGIRKMAAKENVECEIAIREGEEPYKLIIEEADEKQAEVIVMGRHGKTGLTKLLMGSVTARVIGHTPLKVLVAPGASDIKWKNLVIATDGSKYSEAAAKAAINLIKRCCKTCTLNVIAVTPKNATEERIQTSENAIKEIKSKAEKENIKVDTFLVKDKAHESIYEVIIEYANRKNADIIIMGSHGRTGIERLLMGSVCERVIGHTDRAVLVVKT